MTIIRYSALSPPFALAVALAVALTAGCTTTSLREAPVTDRSARDAPAARGEPAPRQASADGSYVVQPGDTLFSIAAAFGRDVKDLTRWNGLDDPAKIRVGQSLRVVPPVDAAVAVPVTPTSAAQSKPLDAATAAPPPTVAAIPEVKPPSADWIWPINGRVIEKFDEKRNKGIDIAGKEGEPVLASGDGQVVYSGSGLRGYGNLVIIKHDDEFISAYAHNRQILVKQGDRVKRGQRIAEVGRSEANQPKLHFEIRRHGKPVDPLAHLPPR